MPAILAAQEVSKIYQMGPNSVTALDNVSLEIGEGEFVAIQGTSGSGKSTLCTAILGEVEQVRGRILLGGIDLLPERSPGRRLVSFVPQRDALHDELTPRRALTLTAALRLAPGIGPEERTRRVDEVLAKLQIAEHADTRIGHLSGGQRKRVAVATELLSEPRLLMLDEPTSGLDEGLDRVMMLLLRRVADSGCTVLVVTHSTANLGLADTVSALDAHGRIAYVGPPQDMLAAFRAAGHAEVMQTLRVEAREQPLRRRVRSRWGLGPFAGARSTVNRAGGERAVAGAGSVGTDLGVWHSTRVLAAREFRRMAATPLTVARGLLLLPLLTVLLTAWADDKGLAGWMEAPNRMQGAAMSVLVTCTTFFGMALSFSTVVGDRAVIEREYRWGVPPAAVVAAKALALLGPVVVQTVVTLTVYLSVRRGPDHTLDGAPVWLVLGVCLAMLGIASMGLGLLVSAFSPNLERAVFLLMGTIAVLVVLTGLLIPLGQPSGVGGHTLATVSQFAPTRWGTAAIAAYLGYVPIELLDQGIRTTTDRLWEQDAEHVLRALLSLLALAVTYALAAARLLARQARRLR